MIFSINLKNNTNSTINFDTAVQPFSIYYNDEQIVESKPYPSFTDTAPERIVNIEKGGIYTLDYILNDDYLFIDNENSYQLVYINHFYDINSNENIDSNSIKTINFSWKKSQESKKAIKQ